MMRTFTMAALVVAALWTTNAKAADTVLEKDTQCPMKEIITVLAHFDVSIVVKGDEKQETSEIMQDLKTQFDRKSKELSDKTDKLGYKIYSKEYYAPRINVYNLQPTDYNMDGFHEYKVQSYEEAVKLYSLLHGYNPKVHSRTSRPENCN